MKVRIIVFDDNLERRESLRYLIEMQDDMEFVGAFENAENAVQDVKSSNPDLILLDVEMPGVNGVDAVKLIKKAHPKVIILMQTVFEDEDIVFEAIENGASGYLLKKTPPEKIVESIHDAIAGGAPMTPTIAMKVLKYFQSHAKSERHDYDLTAREKEILASLVDGNSYKMVASELNISYNTVNTHVRHVYEKLHVHSLGEAVAKALKENLL